MFQQPTWHVRHSACSREERYEQRFETVTDRDESQGALMEMYATDPTPRVHPPTVESWADALRRVRSEYAEMPDLRLTQAQAQRLLGLDPFPCGLVLSLLVDEGYLHVTNGFYAKR